MMGLDSSWTRGANPLPTLNGTQSSGMTDVPDKAFERRGKWSLNKDALRRLLNWLDGGAESDGQAYLEMRRRLTDYFVRKNCPAADDLADETLTRVARRLEEEGITRADTPARYCYIVARFVFLEHLRETRAHRMVTHGSGDVAPEPIAPSAVDAAEAAATREKRFTCLQKGLEELDPLNRRIITRYYIGSERVKIDNRRELAVSLGLSVNALTIRACRIRTRLEAGVRRCVAA
jgi:DNA-directed RNA polymerase specialized sigma24 family protein